MSVRDGESGRDVVLVLGATYNQVPLIRKVQQMGLGAWATGAGDTSECEGVADRVLQIDTSDVGAILDLVRGGPIRGLVTCGTATAICTIATINAELGLSRTVIAPRVAEDAAIKENFRRILGPAALVPRGAVVSEFEELLRAADELSFPLVLKPVDTGGGKGVEVVSGPGENLVQAYARSIAHCRSGRLIVEEFVEGVTFGVESITIAGEVHVLAVAEKTLTGFPHCVTTGVIFPSERLEPHLEAIERVNRDTIARLGIEWGPTHIDMVLSESGEPIVIDVGPRLAGGPIASTLIESATGYDYYRATIDLSLGRPVEAPPAKPTDRTAARQPFRDPRRGGDDLGPRLRPGSGRVSRPARLPAAEEGGRSPARRDGRRRPAGSVPPFGGFPGRDGGENPSNGCRC